MSKQLKKVAEESFVELECGLDRFSNLEKAEILDLIADKCKAMAEGLREEADGE